MAIDFYKEFGDLGYLANYADYGFTIDGVYYPTVEHYYQASKYDDKNIRERIINAKTAKEASNIGRDRANKRIPNFRDIKLQEMYNGIFNKFWQNPGIRAKLLETRNQEIRELSTKESYWGVGPNFDGENQVGKILMKVRKDIREELINTIINSAKGKKVYVIGHKNPDIDSVTSALLLTRILRSFGIDAVFAVRDKEFVDTKMMRDFISDNYEVVSDYVDKQFILVDHNQLLGIPKENVLGAFDHHRISGEVDNLIEAEYSSCTLLLYDLFKDRYAFSAEDRELVALGVLGDTSFLTSVRFIGDDVSLYEDLGVDFDPDKMRKKYFEKTNFRLSVNSVFFQDYKEYDYDKLKIKRSFIKSDSKQRVKYYNKFVKEMEANSINLLIWCDYDELSTYICYNGINLKFPYFTASTYLVLDYLKEKRYLKK